MRQSFTLTNTAWAVGQAGLLGLAISSLYKFFTGRVPPEVLSQGLTDISRNFQFGFYRGGVFNGWPSSHTAAAFAVAAALIMLYPNNKTIKWLALIYAFYIGLGVSISFHWFSDFVAGAIIGTLIGTVIGKSFRPRGIL
jgi:membrane-associated phospholipid phosphatase